MVADDAALHAHLTSCAACRSYQEEIVRTGKLLRTVSADRPTNEEMQSMWNTLALSLPGGSAVTMTPNRSWRGLWRVARYAAPVAAVLFIAAQLGSLQYGGEIWIPGLPSLSSARMQGVTSRKLADDSAARDSGNGVFASADERVSGTSGSLADSKEENNWARKWTSTVARPSRGARKAVPGEGGSAGGERPSDAQLDDSVARVRSAAPPTLEPLPARTATVQIMADGHANYERTDLLTGALASANQADLSQVTVTGMQDILHSQVPLPKDRSALQQMQVQSPGKIGLVSDDRAGNVPNQERAASAPGMTESESGAPSTAKIIRTGKLVVEVPSYVDTAGRVEQIVAKHGGFIGDSNVVELTGGAIVGTVVIRVPAEQFEGLFAALKALGRIVSEHSDAADVTAAYVDLEARIHSHQVTEERLHDLVRNKSIVDKVSSLLEVERELQRVRSEIEQMQGELRVMADRVALSTITLTLSEPKRIVPSASLSVEVSTVEEAGAALGATLAAIDGRLISGKTSKRSDGTLTATYQLQTPLSRFGELMNAIQGMGRIEERQVSDREFTQVNEPWAAKVQCNVALIVFERSRQLPTGTMFVQADNLNSALQQLESVLEPTGARVVSNYTMVDSQGASKAEVTLSVPAAQFAALIARVGQLGRVNSQTVTGEITNISGGAASVLRDLRLTVTEVVREVPKGQISVEVDVFATARELFSTLVAEKELQVLDSSSQQNHDGSWMAGFQLGVEAKDMEAVVGRLESLGRVVSRNMQGIGLGSLSRTDPSALGHLSVSIAEKSAIAPAPQQAGQTLRTHLRDGLAGLYKSIGLIAYGLIVMGPWLAIAILLGWLIGRVRSRRAKAST